jgi:RNA polymerase sigma-70 factor (ECF subfamily)
VKTSERDLVLRIQAGEREAFRSLYEAHGPPLLRFLRRLLSEAAAEDALQETFLRAHAARETLDPDRPLRPYLLRIARNVGIAALRREAVRKALPVDEVEPPQDEGSGPASDALRNETRVQVRAALEDLPPGLRSALLLRYEEGLTLRAVGEALGVGERTARVRLREASVQLARALRQQGYLQGGKA